MNYPYYQPSQPMMQQYYRPQQYMMEQPQTQQVIIKGRPVSSIEEVRATSIDFDGSVFYFPDIANKKIYTKQINLDGTSTLNVYELKNTPVVNSSQYITREEFETALLQIKQALEQKEPQPIVVQQKATSQEPKKEVSMNF